MTTPTQQLSYVCGSTTQPLLYRCVGDVLRHAAERWPEHDALVVRHQDTRLTYRELDHLVSRLALALIACGLKAGDRLGIWSPNRLEWVLAQFASARAGIVLVNINPAYRLAELEFALRKVGCRALLLAPAFKSSDYIGMVRTLLAESAFQGGGRVGCAALPELDRFH